MLKIRLKRNGRKKQAIYRIIVIDSKKRRDGRALEELGFYNPMTRTTRIDLEKIESRIAQGAQLTRTVKSIVNRISSKG